MALTFQNSKCEPNNLLWSIFQYLIKDLKSFMEYFPIPYKRFKLNSNLLWGIGKYFIKDSQVQLNTTSGDISWFNILYFGMENTYVITSGKYFLILLQGKKRSITILQNNLPYHICTRHHSWNNFLQSCNCAILRHIRLCQYKKPNKTCIHKCIYFPSRLQCQLHSL